MSISQSMLPEFDNEMSNTRKTLERVPEDKFDWRPHVRSQTMRWLASHIANIPHWVAITMETDALDLTPPDGQPPPQTPQASSRQQLLEFFDKNVASAREAIAGATDEKLLEPWTLLNKGQTILSIPRVAVIRGFVMNHTIHHRAQLTVYFRLNDVPVPALYGPSADEGGF